MAPRPPTLMALSTGADALLELVLVLLGACVAAGALAAARRHASGRASPRLQDVAPAVD
jgi:hypothetical protein